MEAANVTRADGFHLLIFSDHPQMQIPLFVVFVLIYPATLMGNLLVMTIIYGSSHLHTPKYFFLSNLSFIDIIYTSVIFSKMLAHFFRQKTYISFTECLLQVYFFMAMVTLEFILLAVMAYDRYVAICNPLRYMTIMNKVVCFRLAAGSWVLGLMDVIPHTVLISGLSFCSSHEINHFFCDVTVLLKLSCTSTLIIEALSYFLGVTVALMSFLLIITSYISIISAILKLKSMQQRQKAFSTCSSHLTVVILLYRSVCSTYLRPTSTYSMKYNKIASLSYITVTPLCNPIIYSLKNKEFKNALKRTNNKA
ncbi:olfactory receptor 5V1-like [Pleurodeles waltl]|uniref:olfactory receptor 5V1-like n=1 Tax=Pleurodeles waltl TaxID=8319 RepID=UPI0037098751